MFLTAHPAPNCSGGRSRRSVLATRGISPTEFQVGWWEEVSRRPVRDDGVDDRPPCSPPGRGGAQLAAVSAPAVIVTRRSGRGPGFGVLARLNTDPPVSAAFSSWGLGRGGDRPLV